MKKILAGINNFLNKPYADVVVLFLLCILSYGILIPWLGWFSDDWFFIWLSRKLGLAGLLRYFTSSRALFSVQHYLLDPLISVRPIFTQIFGLLAHFLSAVSLWLLVRSLWPQKRSLAAWSAFLYVVYPGFIEHPAALVYGHLYLVLAIALLSLWLTSLAIRNPRRFWFFSALAFILGVLNLLLTEYFFFVELLRPVVIWITASGQKKKLTFNRFLLFWLPYLVCFIGVVLWRVVGLGQAFEDNFFTFAVDARSNFFAAARNLLISWLKYLYTSVIQPWGKLFSLPSSADIGRTAWILYFLVMAAAGALVAALHFSRRTRRPERREDRTTRMQVLVFALVTVCLLGAPFFLTSFVTVLDTSLSRGTLPVAFGVGILLLALLMYIPVKRGWKIALLAILLALGVGRQFQRAAFYRVAWMDQTRTFWNITWRMPQLETNTVLVTNDQPLAFINQATALSSALDWIYAPEKNSERISYVIVYASEYPELAIPQNLVLPYPGSELIVDPQHIIYTYVEGGCIQLLTPKYAFEYPTLKAASLALTEVSSTTAIHDAPDASAIQPQVTIFGSEPTHDWCYYYLKADLARQQADWPAVIDREEQALAAVGFPDEHPVWAFPLLQAYAAEGRWQDLLPLFEQTYQAFLQNKGINPADASRAKDLQSIQDRFSGLWSYILSISAPSAERDAAQQQIMILIGNPAP